MLALNLQNLKVLTVLCGNANVSKCQATLFHVVTGWPVNLTHTDFSCPEVCMGFFSAWRYSIMCTVFVPAKDSFISLLPLS